MHLRRVPTPPHLTELNRTLTASLCPANSHTGSYYHVPVCSRAFVKFTRAGFYKVVVAKFRKLFTKATNVLGANDSRHYVPIISG